MKNIRLLFGLLFVLCAAGPAPGARAARAPIPTVSRDPYLGAIVVSSDGEVLFEDNADAVGYPASTVKLMNLLLILEKIERGELGLQDPVSVTAEASGMGGTQVFLKENEVFPVQELLYALMIQSANDAAVALAVRISGTKDGFVDLMNRRAEELGMRKTRFHSVHGLPPSEGQEPDLSSPRDLARLSLALLRRPETLGYTSVIKKPFRADSPSPFIMENHNRLLGTLEGCDGFKTGFIKAGGYSIAATAARGGHRVVAVVMGSLDRKVRDAKTREFLLFGLSTLAQRPPPPPAPPPAVPAPPVIPAAEPEKAEQAAPRGKWKWGLVVVLVLGGAGLLAWIKRPKYTR